MTNYETLYGGLKQPEDFEDKDWFKPVKGINKITFKSEFSEPKEITYKEKTFKKVFVDVVVNEKDYVWSITVGNTKNSLYGQILEFAVKNGGQLTDKTLKLAVQGEGKETRYTVLDILEENQE